MLNHLKQWYQIHCGLLIRIMVEWLQYRYGPNSNRERHTVGT